MNDPVGLMATLQLFSTYGGQLPPIGENLSTDLLESNQGWSQPNNQNKAESVAQNLSPVLPDESLAFDEAASSTVPGDSLHKRNPYEWMDGGFRYHLTDEEIEQQIRNEEEE